MLTTADGVSLRVPIEPFGAARHRHRWVKPRGGRPGYIQTYDDSGYAAWRKTVAPYFQRAAPRGTLLGPLECLIVAVHEFRKSDFRKTRFVPRQWHGVKPDVDNIAKAVLDAAQDARWLLDDCQVARLIVEAVYAAQGEPPSFSVTLRPLEPYHVR